jgi:hypothetical protein
LSGEILKKNADIRKFFQYMAKSKPIQKVFSRHRKYLNKRSWKWYNKQYKEGVKRRNKNDSAQRIP